MHSDGTVKSGPYPTLLGKIENKNGDHCATQRFYLTSEGKKANVQNAKKAVGKIGGGYIPIGKLTGSVAAIAEGPETSIAVNLGTGLPTFSAISAPNMKNLNLPESISEFYIFADRDKSKAGEDAAMALAERLNRQGKIVYLIIPEQSLLGESKTIDFLDIFNKDPALLKKYFAEAVKWVPNQKQNTLFPQMRPEAFHGLMGEFISRVSPHTEADPNGILGQFIVLIGNVIGRACRYRVGATFHFLIFFAVMVGDSSKARKGDALQICLYLFKQIDPDWFKKRIVKGLSSGEGIIHALRDPTFEGEPIKDKHGNVVGTKMVESDPGVSDKRLLAIEGEFVATLKVATREGNTLTAVLREAWDGNALQTLTKSNSESVQEPHFSSIAHITSFELKKSFSETDAMNGTGNRILWFLVKRSKKLPFGGDLASVNLDDLILALNSAILFARQQREIKMDKTAREIWPQMYDRLTREEFGIFGSITARAEAQVVRLAMLYAVLDQSPFITETHLKAALAVWDYTEESCRQLFGDLSGHPVADKILGSLKNQPDGMTRTEITSLFSRHVSSDGIQKALDYLRKNSLAEEVEEFTKGRPTGRWFAI